MAQAACAATTEDDPEIGPEFDPAGGKTRFFGDGRKFLASLPEGQVAACFFDPQYRGVIDRLAFGNEGARQKGRARLEQMSDDTIREFMEGIVRVLKPSGHLFLWIDKFHLCEGITPWIEGLDIQTVDMVTWHKGRMGMGYRTRRISEYLMILQKRPLRAKGVWTRSDIRDVWEEKIGRKEHPHMKPVGLQAAMIQAVCKPCELVIDPAAGSFSVEAAVRQAGEDRVFLGADLVECSSS